MDDFENINETGTEESDQEKTETEETDQEETETEESDQEEVDQEETDEEWTIDEGGHIALTEVNPNTIDNSAYLENITTTIIFLDACIIGCFVALLFAIGFKKE